MKRLSDPVVAGLLFSRKIFRMTDRKSSEFIHDNK
jgi:hypothetical protein